MKLDRSDWWWDAEENEVHEKLLDYISTVESAQSDIYERFLRLACLYDPYERMGHGAAINVGPDAIVSENVVASNVDTVAAIISRSKPRARFMTDDGDWSMQRRAKRLEWYAEGLAKKLDVHAKAQCGFADGAKFGTGIAKVFEDGKTVRVERVLVDEIIVDERECRSGPPRHLAQRRFVDRDVMKAAFPEKADEIDRAHGSGANAVRWHWADYREVERNQIVVVEGWRLPIGEKGSDGYVPGRHVWCADGVTFVDEPYHKPFFPFAVFRWSDRTTGWYGIGLAERIAGHQRVLNKTNWQIDRQLDQYAVPTTFVKKADAALAVKTTNRIGTVVSYNTEKPVTVFPPAVSGETYQRQATIKASAYEESGVSRLSATSMKPAGLDSGAALREYKDSTTERFAIQEQRHEQFVMDVIWLMLDAAKDLGDSAPRIYRKSRYGKEAIDWADVDMGEVRVQMEPASNLSRTPAGRTQTVIEWAQAGVISQDEARRLLHHPDTERAMSLYTAALEDIERCIEEILDGELLVPEPYQNLQMGVWRMQMAYLKARGDGAPEDVLEGLRTWITQAAHTLNPPPTPTAQMPMDPMAAPMDPMLAPPMDPPMEAPMQGAPVAAFAPQAMQLAPA